MDLHFMKLEARPRFEINALNRRPHGVAFLVWDAVDNTQDLLRDFMSRHAAVQIRSQQMAL